jgi:hypothetical protein
MRCLWSVELHLCGSCIWIQDANSMLHSEEFIRIKKFEYGRDGIVVHTRLI